jgi:hypothetical protein
MYAKIVDDKTKEVSVGIGTDTKFYQSIGMTDMEVEQAYDGRWYVKGYAPTEPTTDEKLAALDADYNRQKQDLINEYTDAQIHGDTDTIALVQQEMTELDKWYDEEYRKIEEETEGE